MPAYPDRAEQFAPIRKLMLVTKAIKVLPTYKYRGESSLAGDLYRYKKNKAIAQRKASLKMVPY